MKCLAIDSSGFGAQVALAEAGEVVAEVAHDLGGGYAESLFGLFDAVLQRAGWDKGDLEQVAVVEGPGSFTGLRVGVMTAKTLAHARAWALSTAHASDLVAVQHRPADLGASKLHVLLSAGRAHAYLRTYAAAEERWSATGPVTRLADVDLDAFANATSDPIRVEASYALRLNRPWARAVSHTLAHQLAGSSSRGAWPARASTVAALEPLYAGPSQAERAHQLDLTEEIRRPQPPVSWK